VRNSISCFFHEKHYLEAWIFDKLLPFGLSTFDLQNRRTSVAQLWINKRARCMRAILPAASKLESTLRATGKFKFHLSRIGTRVHPMRARRRPESSGHILERKSGGSDERVGKRKKRRKTRRERERERCDLVGHSPRSSTSRSMTPPMCSSPFTRKLLSTCRSVT